jgi:hypothetical protein
MAVLADVPGEDRLRALSRRFADAERRVRALVTAAPEGDRRELLREALTILVDLRELATGADLDLMRAYAIAAGGISSITGEPVPDAERARDLGRTLALRLDRAAARAEEGARSAIASVTAETLDNALTTASTGYVNTSGARLPLGRYTDMQIETLGRSATSRGTRDAVRRGGFIQISSHHTESEICKPIEGKVYPVDAPSTRWPPYHPYCRHLALPVGSSEAQVIAAMTSVA